MSSVLTLVVHSYVGLLAPDGHPEDLAHVVAIRKSQDNVSVFEHAEGNGVSVCIDAVRFENHASAINNTTLGCALPSNVVVSV